jgi:hypothetical protein
MFRILQLLTAAVLLALSSISSHAQATRTWVSGVGDDANPCSRTAPCKTFAGAISKTAAGGEISVLDPGGFGAVTITKSISIIARGAEGSIVAAGTNGIVINAAATDEITIHGITFEGIGTGLNGIRVLSANAVHVSNCVIRGFQAAGQGKAISVGPTATNTKVFVSQCILTKNRDGVDASAVSPGRATVFLDRVAIASNAEDGVRAVGGRSTVRMSNSVVTGNMVGLVSLSNGKLISFGNNVVAGNPIGDGTFTETLPQQ